MFTFLHTQTFGQKKSDLLTKFFFEFGFVNCEVKITNRNTILFNERLNRDSTSRGATKIVLIKGMKCHSIKLNICGKIKKIDIQKGKFYIISIINNEIEIEEVEIEPFYV